MRTRRILYLGALASSALFAFGCRDESGGQRYQKSLAQRGEMQNPRDGRPAGGTEKDVHLTGEADDMASTEALASRESDLAGIGGSGDEGAARANPQAQPMATDAMDQTALVARLHAINMEEVKMGALAKTNAGARGVKGYGDMLMKDHKKADEDLVKLIEKKGWTMAEAAPDPEADKKMNELKDKQGAAFDAPFAQMMVEGHDKALAMVKANLPNVQDKDLKSMLKDLQPKLEHHKKMAQSLADQKPAASGRRTPAE